MGLDQYLMKKVNDDNAEDIEKIYWRKANFVHRYFTEFYYDDGFESDDCTPFPTTIEDLETLLELCKLVEENKSKARHLLPTMSGFFFGSTDYDEYYFKEIGYTIRKLEELLETATDDDEFYYYAWY